MCLKSLSKMNSEDGQVYSVCISCNFLAFTKYNLMCSQNINKQIVNIADEHVTDYSFSVGITILNQRIIWEDDIEFVAEFPCLLGHPVHCTIPIVKKFLALLIDLKMGYWLKDK